MKLQKDWESTVNLFHFPSTFYCDGKNTQSRSSKYFCPRLFTIATKSIYCRREESESFTFIDAYNGGASHMPRSCPALAHQPRQHIRREAYSAVEPRLVFQRMVNNLIQSSRVQWDHGRFNHSFQYFFVIRN